MRKTTNIITLLCIALLVLDILSVQNILLNFLLAGELPFVQIIVPPSLMLALMSFAGWVLIFELLSRKVTSIRRLRQTLLGIIRKRFLAVKNPQPLDTV